MFATQPKSYLATLLDSLLLTVSILSAVKTSHIYKLIFFQEAANKLHMEEILWVLSMRTHRRHLIRFHNGESDHLKFSEIEIILLQLCIDS